MKRCISLVIAFGLILSLNGFAFATNDNSMFEEQIFTLPTKEELLASEQKTKDMSRLVELLGLGYGNVKSQTCSLAARMEAKEIMAKYSSAPSPYSVLSKWDSTKAISSYLNLSLPQHIQSETYYCGPASAIMVLKKEGKSNTHYITQNYLAGSTLSPTRLQTNYYHQTPFDSNWDNTMTFYSNHTYSRMMGDPYDSTNHAIALTNSAIGTLASGYGVIYDTVQYQYGTARLVGYNSLTHDMYHYVAGEGYDTADPYNRLCLYVDPNGDNASAVGHRQIGFRLMCTLVKDRGIVF